MNSMPLRHSYVAKLDWSLWTESLALLPRTQHRHWRSFPWDDCYVPLRSSEYEGLTFGQSPVSSPHHVRLKRGRPGGRPKSREETPKEGCNIERDVRCCTAQFSCEQSR